MHGGSNSSSSSSIHSGATAMNLQRNLVFDGIVGDAQVFLHVFESKAEEVSAYLKEIGFAIGVYFMEHALSFFADLFNHEVLFRVWDVAFVESSSVYRKKIAYYFIAVMTTFLSMNAGVILRTGASTEKVRLVLSLAGKFDMDCDAFIKASMELY